MNIEFVITHNTLNNIVSYVRIVWANVFCFFLKKAWIELDFKEVFNHRDVYAKMCSHVTSIV